MTNSTATLEYMRKVRTVFCPDFLAQYKSIPLWRSTVFGWTALDPVLTQNPKKAGRAGRKQRKIRRANGGKTHKSEPKRLRFVRETTYGPEGRGFEHLLVHVHNIHTALPNGIARITEVNAPIIEKCGELVVGIGERNTDTLYLLCHNASLYPIKFWHLP